MSKHLFTASSGTMSYASRLLYAGNDVAIPMPDINDDLWYRSPRFPPGTFHRVQIKAATGATRRDAIIARINVQGSKRDAPDQNYTYVIPVYGHWESLRGEESDWRYFEASAEEMHDYLDGEPDKNGKISLNIWCARDGSSAYAMADSRPRKDRPLRRANGLSPNRSPRARQHLLTPAYMAVYAASLICDAARFHLVCSVPMRTGPQEIWLMGRKTCRTGIIRQVAIDAKGRWIVGAKDVQRSGANFFVDTEDDQPGNEIYRKGLWRNQLTKLLRKKSRLPLRCDNGWVVDRYGQSERHCSLFNFTLHLKDDRRE